MTIAREERNAGGVCVIGRKGEGTMHEDSHTSAGRGVYKEENYEKREGTSKRETSRKKKEKRREEIKLD